MQADDNRRNRSNIPFSARLLLVLIVWFFAILVMFVWTASAMPKGLLIAAMGEEDSLPIWWSQDAVCVLYVMITWAILSYSRPVAFYILIGVLISLLLFNTLLFVAAVGSAEVRFFP